MLHEKLDYGGKKDNPFKLLRALLTAAFISICQSNLTPDNCAFYMNDFWFHVRLKAGQAAMRHKA